MFNIFYSVHFAGCCHVEMRQETEGQLLSFWKDMSHGERWKSLDWGRAAIRCCRGFHVASSAAAPSAATKRWVLHTCCRHFACNWLGRSPFSQPPFPRPLASRCWWWAAIAIWLMKIFMGLKLPLWEWWTDLPHTLNNTHSHHNHSHGSRLDLLLCE